MGLILAIFIGGVFAMLASFYWRRAGDEDAEWRTDEWRLFRRWLLTGCVAPLLLWIFFNLGIVGPPVWPAVAPVSAGWAPWWKSFDEFAFASAFLISSYWTGITFAWLLCRAFVLAESGRDFFILCAVWSVLLLPLALIIANAGGWGAVGMAMMLYFLPLVHIALNLKPEKPPVPSYSRALAKINFGRYDEAEMEVIRELEQCEEDFDGWMMLAELYATHFHDLAGAAATVRDICAQPATTPVQMSIALHKLADWYLKLGHDPISARRALDEISARIPGTHLDKMARQRSAQLPATTEELREREKGKPLRLPNMPDELQPPPAPVLTLEQAAADANGFVQTLTRNPDDVTAREKFARLLAENLGDADTAIEQLQLLLAMPEQPPTRRAEWLVTMAGWHARYRNDADEAKLIYQQVMRDFGDTPQAFTAQRRVNLLNVQSQFRRRFAERMRASV
jgi:hypothetical protein